MKSKKLCVLSTGVAKVNETKRVRINLFGFCPPEGKSEKESLGGESVKGKFLPYFTGRDMIPI